MDGRFNTLFQETDSVIYPLVSRLENECITGEMNDVSSATGVLVETGVRA